MAEVKGQQRLESELERGRAVCASTTRAAQQVGGHNHIISYDTQKLFVRVETAAATAPTPANGFDRLACVYPSLLLFL